jgi:hypothetical protein
MSCGGCSGAYVASGYLQPTFACQAPSSGSSPRPRRTVSQLLDDGDLPRAVAGDIADFTVSLPDQSILVTPDKASFDDVLARIRKTGKVDRFGLA